MCVITIYKVYTYIYIHEYSYIYMVNRGYEQPYIYLDLLLLDHKRGIVFSMWDYVGVFGCIWWIMKGACDIL